MSHIETVFTTARYREQCEDRVAVIEAEERTILVVADGAGGTGSGQYAAETVLREIEAAYQEIHSADQWAALLKQIDYRISGGETTAVVVDLRPYGIAGASVGDSRAWVIDGETILDLTQNQNRKPLLGSGNAEPAPFMHSSLSGLLLAGTDGFFDYAKRESILPMIAQAEFCTIPRKCVEMVQLPSGELWDDVGIIAARVRPKLHSRKRYSI